VGAKGAAALATDSKGQQNQYLKKKKKKAFLLRLTYFILCSKIKGNSLRIGEFSEAHDSYQGWPL